VGGHIHARVSVVIPAFRSSDHIAQTLDSVFAQSLPPQEVLVVNDGSPDTEKLEQALHPYLSRIRYLKQNNSGPGSARNNAIRQASGDYIGFLDSDDVWFSDHLAKHLAVIARNPRVGLVYSDSVLVRDDIAFDRAFGQQPQHPPVTFESLLVEDCAIWTSSVVASRSALLEAGLFDENFWRCEDFDLWLRMAFHGTGMDFLREPTLYRSSSRDGLSSDRYQMKCALIEVYRKIGSTLPVSAEQQRLIQRCIRRVQAGSELDLLKQHLAASQYGLALQAAERARTLDENGKIRLAVLGLKRAPRFFKYWYQVYESWLRFRSHVRGMRAPRISRLAAPPLR